MKTFVHGMAWLNCIIAAAMACLAFAPFTAAIGLTIFLLPLSAFTAWKGALIPSAISFALCMVAFIISPITMPDMLRLPLLLALVAAGFALTLLGLYKGIRRNCRFA